MEIDPKELLGKPIVALCWDKHTWEAGVWYFVPLRTLNSGVRFEGTTYNLDGTIETESKWYTERQWVLAYDRIAAKEVLEVLGKE